MKSLQGKLQEAEKTAPDESKIIKATEERLQEEHTNALEAARSAHQNELEDLRKSTDEVCATNAIGTLDMLTTYTPGKEVCRGSPCLGARGPP